MTTPLKAHREKHRMTARFVALELGITPSHYRRVEIGETSASIELANRLEKFFGREITRDQILYPEDYIDSGARKPNHPTQLAEAS